MEIISNRERQFNIKKQSTKIKNYSEDSGFLLGRE